VCKCRVSKVVAIVNPLINNGVKDKLHVSSLENLWNQISTHSEPFEVACQIHPFEISVKRVDCSDNFFVQYAEMRFVFSHYDLHIWSQVECKHVLSFFLDVNFHLLAFVLHLGRLLLGFESILDFFVHHLYFGHGQWFLHNWSCQPFN